MTGQVSQSLMHSIPAGGMSVWHWDSEIDNEMKRRSINFLAMSARIFLECFIWFHENWK